MKTFVGIAAAALILYLVLRPSSAEKAAPTWHEEQGGKDTVGVFGLDWG
jgi:hypothetical protein